MALPTFTLTGSVEYLQGITLTPLSSTQVGLTCNFPWSSFLNTTDAASLLLIRPIGVMFNSSGQLVNTDGTPVQLLADDPSLGLSGPVQWQVKIGNQPAWWFDAPGDGATIDLKDTSAGTGVFPTNITSTLPGPGIIKSTGTALSTAISGTDYAPATTGNSILKGSGSGGFTAAIPSTDYAPATSGTSLLKANGSGGFSAASSTADYVPWSGGAGGVLPATSGQHLTTQGGNTLDDGSGNVVIKGGTLNGVTIGATTAAPSVNAASIQSPNIVFSGTTKPWINNTSTLTGTINSSPGVVGLNNIVLNDGVVFASDTSWLVGVQVLLNVSAPAVGARMGLSGGVNILGVGASDFIEAQWVGAHGSFDCAVNVGGTDFTANGANTRGTDQGGSFVASLRSGATYHSFLGGLGCGVRVETGASVYGKIAFSINNLSDDAVRGTVDDIAFCIFSNGAATATWKNGISFGRNQAGNNSYLNWPFASDSTLITASSPGTGSLPANIGIDFTTVTFSGPAFKAGRASICLSELGPLTPPSPSGTGECNLYVDSLGNLHFVSPTTDYQVSPTVPAGGFAPVDYGYINWSFDPTQVPSGGAAAPAAGKQLLILVPVRYATTITNVVVYVAVAGSGLTSGECFAGLFNGAGTLLSATADQSTAWQSTGTKVMALTTPQAVTAGDYYVAVFGNGTTMPQFVYAGQPLIGARGAMTTHPRAVLDTTNIGLTTAFHSPATLTATNNNYWAAVS